jgi:predicted  nucleic acid-binding Zn-ribbon protein
MKALSRAKKMVAGGALVLAGFGAGAAVAVTGSASAATDAVSSGVSQAATQLDPTKSVRPDEHLLTGTTAAKVRAAALAKYPDASIQRVETDSDGVYEAHIVTADGEQLIVQVGSDFSITGTQQFGAR